MTTRVAFAGREAESASLRDALDDAMAGRGGLVFVVGDAGMGKTRLLDWLADEAAATDARAAWGRCWEGGGAPPFWPWIEVLRSVLPPNDAADLATRMGWEVDDRVTSSHASPVNPVSEDHGARFRLFDAVGTALGRVATEAPVLLLLEDLHAADDASLLLLQFLCHRVSELPLLIVGTYRPVDAAASSAAAALTDAGRHGSVVALSGLDETAVRQVLDAVSGSATADVVREVLTASGGNPLFIIEMARLMLRGQRGVPEGVRQILSRRLRMIDDDSRRVLAAAAVIGRRFRQRDLEHVADVDAEMVLHALTIAAGVQLVEEHESGEWSFVHDLLRETAASELRASERRLLHRRAADVLSARPDRQPAEIAHHACEGGAADAVARCRAAGDHALAALAYEEAEQWYRRGRELVTAESPESYELSMAAGLASHRRGALVERRHHYLDAAEWARAAGDPAAFARAAVGAVGYCDSRYDPQRIALLEEAAAGLEEDCALRARVLAELSQNLFIASLYGGPDRTDDGRRLSGEAVAMARRVGDANALAAALFGHHYILMDDDDSLDVRLPIARELLVLSQQLGEPERIAIAHQWLAHDLLDGGDPVAAEAEVAAAMRLARESRQPFTMWGSAYPQAGFALARGRLDQAERLADEALDSGRRTGFADVDGVDSVLRFALRRAQGRLPELAAELGIVGTTDEGLTSGVLVFVAIGLAETDAIDQASTVLAASGRLAVPRDGGTRAWGASGRTASAAAMVAEAAWMCREVSAAEGLYDALLPYRNRWETVAFLLSLGGSFEHYLGLLASLLGRTDAAVEHFAEARRRHEEFGARLLVAHTDAAEGSTYLTAGEPERARPLLERALAAYRAMGTPTFAERVEHQLAAQPTTLRPTVSGRFQRDGSDWVVGFGDQATRVRDSVGMEYLARLLAVPGRELHCLELASNEHFASGDAGELLDDQAKAAYRQRLHDIDNELDEAARNNDPARGELLELERERLIAELKAAVGLGGRDRRAAADAERARLSVTRAVRRAIDRVADADADVGRHLTATVRTGVYCCYQPDPQLDLRWNT